MFKKPAPPPRKPISLRLNHWRNDQHGKINKIAVDVSESQLERIIAIAYETEQPDDAR